MLSLIVIVNVYFESLLHYNNHSNSLSSLESSFIDTGILWCVDLLSSLSSNQIDFSCELESYCLFGLQRADECLHEVLKNVIHDTREILFDDIVNRRQCENGDDVVSSLDILTSFQLSNSSSFQLLHDHIIHSIKTLSDDTVVVILALLDEYIHFYGSDID